MGLPLKGMRVLDLTKDFAGPFCTMMLADLGAEVIKIERPGVGDETRAWGPPFTKGQSYYFLSLNRRKKSIALNLKSPNARKIVRDLVRDSDVVMESFRPGSLAKFKLDYKSLRRINKALVYCSISGFGQTGPYRDRPGYDLAAFAMSGIMSTTGEEGRPPVRVSVPVADIAAGHYATTAVLALMAKRLVTGKGDYVDISLLDSITSWSTYNATYYFATGQQMKRMGSAHPSIVPYQAFRCKDKDLIVAIGNDEQWRSFCDALGLVRLRDDQRFGTNPLRVQNRNVLIPLLAKKFRQGRADQWYRKLTSNRVPSALVNNIRDMLHDPQVRHRGLVLKTADGTRLLGSPLTYSTLRSAGVGSVPLLGQHTIEVLAGLGYSRKRIDDLRESGAIE